MTIELHPWLIMEKRDPSARRRVKSMMCSRVAAWSRQRLTRPSAVK